VDPTLALLVALGLLAVAIAYSSVGHAGASGYIAVMTLAGIASPEIRPAALGLNLVVGGIGLVRFARAGHVAWRAVLPLVLTSAPMAWVGARLRLPEGVHDLALAAVLGVSALALMGTAAGAPNRDASIAAPRVPWLAGLATGAAIGLLSGITGTGGAIFLTPVLLAAGWAATRDASGISVAFVWANSLLGLLGLAQAGLQLPSAFPWWVVAVVAGALAGTQLGIRLLPVPALRRMLGAVLLVAAAKLAFT
jgi:uncharacterized membrane protein YfcA